jgi:hypothetical protein
MDVLALKALQGSCRQQVRHVVHICDYLLQLVVAGAHTTDCHGPGRHGTVPQVRSRGSSGDCRLQKFFHLADARSAGVRCRDCLKEGAREQGVVE